MESKPSSPLRLLIWAQRYADAVMARDNLHLGHALISKAAARRVRQGIKPIEAYLRRVCCCMRVKLRALDLPQPHSPVANEPQCR